MTATAHKKISTIVSKQSRIILNGSFVLHYRRWKQTLLSARTNLYYNQWAKPAGASMCFVALPSLRIETVLSSSPPDSFDLARIIVVMMMIIIIRSNARRNR